MGNLLFEVESRSDAIRIGLIETIFSTIDRVRQRLNTTINEEMILNKEVKPNNHGFYERKSIAELPTVEEGILVSAIRCVRICGGDYESKNQVCRSRVMGKPEFENRNSASYRLNAILKVGEILIFPEVESLSDNLKFQILFALTVLTEKMNGPTLEIIEEVSGRCINPYILYISP